MTNVCPDTAINSTVVPALPLRLLTTLCSFPTELRVLAMKPVCLVFVTMACVLCPQQTTSTVTPPAKWPMVVYVLNMQTVAPGIAFVMCAHIGMEVRSKTIENDHLDASCFVKIIVAVL